MITDLEAKVFSAAALAHNATGRPISTHTSFSTMGLEQLALLKQHGVDLSRVVIGHCDLKDNIDDILRMIDLGAYVQFDTIGKTIITPTQNASLCCSPCVKGAAWTTSCCRWISPAVLT